MSHPHMKCLDLGLSWLKRANVNVLRVIVSALCMTNLTSLSIDIIGCEDDEEVEGEKDWGYELDGLQFMTNLESLRLSMVGEKDNDVLSIKNDKIFSSLTRLTNLSYRRDHSCNSDDSLMVLTNLKSLSIKTIDNYHVTPSFIERLSHVNIFSFEFIVTKVWQDVVSYFRDNSSLYEENLEGGQISQIRNEFTDGWLISMSFDRIRH
jgi:hypothetical protein